MRSIHAVLVCPQLGAGILTVGKAVDRSVGDGQAVGRIIIVADFNSSLTGSTVIAVIEGAFVYDKVGGIFTIRSAVEQDCLAVGVEGA